MNKCLPVITGLDCLIRDGFKQLKNRNTAILANPAAISSKYEHLVKILLREKATKVRRLFAPEHGFSAALQDMEYVSGAQDRTSGLEIISLYGKSDHDLHPTQESLADIELLLVDLPDIGSRYYTFATTLAYCMHTAAMTKTTVMVLDRPNPLGGVQIEGSGLSKQCRSFCGYAPIANRHGLTIGEFARLVNSGFGEDDNFIPGPKCELEIIKCEDWTREMYFDQTRLPWVLPSPNMPTLDTAIVYPGSCLFEATTISEGRGTTRPFELIGAPYIESESWITACYKELQGIPGAVLRPAEFIPAFHKHQGKVCRGIQIHVTNREIFQPYRLGLALLLSLAKLYPENFSWRQGEYEFIKDTPAIDLLFGDSSFRKVVETKGSLSPILDRMELFEKHYSAARKPFLIYRS